MTSDGPSRGYPARHSVETSSPMSSDNLTFFGSLPESSFCSCCIAESPPTSNDLLSQCYPTSEVSLNPVWNIPIKVSKGHDHMGEYVDANVILPYNDDISKDNGVISMLFHKMFARLPASGSFRGMSISYLGSFEPGDCLHFVARQDDLLLLGNAKAFLPSGNPLAFATVHYDSS
jgi:hypothetical protein